MTGSHDEKFKLQQYILLRASSSIHLTSNIKEGWRWVLLAVLHMEMIFFRVRSLGMAECKFEHLSSGCFQSISFRQTSTQILRLRYAPLREKPWLYELTIVFSCNFIAGLLSFVSGMRKLAWLFRDVKYHASGCDDDCCFQKVINHSSHSRIDEEISTVWGCWVLFVTPFQPLLPPFYLLVASRMLTRHNI